jgi:hypothetical protein
MNTIIYTTLTPPSPIKGEEGKKLSRCVYYIRLVEFLLTQSSHYQGRVQRNNKGEVK